MPESFLPSDSDLLTEFAESGSERPFEMLVRRHGALVLSVCRGILRDANDAEDAAQAAFLTLARKAKSLIGHRTIAGWLHTVAWHISCRARRARTLRQQREREAAEVSAAQRDASAPAFADTSLLHEQLHALSDKYRLPLILHHFDGWSEAEVAQILGCKLGTISGRLSRGRQILKERLEARGMSSAAAGADRHDSAALGATAAAPELMAPIDEISRRRAAPAAAFVALASRAGSMIHRQGGVTEGAVSTQAAALSDGILRVMQRARIRALVAVAVAFAIVGSLVGLIALNAAPRSSDGGGATAAPAPFFPVVPRAGNSISGIVLDPDGKPAGEVTVRLYASKADALEGRRALARFWTGMDGSFTLDSLPPGKNRYLLCFMERPTFMHAEMNLDIAAGDVIDVGKLTLKLGRY
ncbi:hypothetical protein BH09PLA1_BH09PLA1_35470 [soil metagenome]